MLNWEKKAGGEGGGEGGGRGREGASDFNFSQVVPLMSVGKHGETSRIWP